MVTLGSTVAIRSTIFGEGCKFDCASELAENGKIMSDRKKRIEEKLKEKLSKDFTNPFSGTTIGILSEILAEEMDELETKLYTAIRKYPTRFR